VRVSAWRSFRGNPLKIDGVFVLPRPVNHLGSKHDFWRVAVSPQASSDLQWRSHVAVYCFFPFSRMKIYTKFGRGLFRCLGKSRLASSEAFFVLSYRLVSCAVRAQSRSPTLDYAQQNTALDSFVSRPMCVSLIFLGGAHWVHCHIDSVLSSSRLRSR